MFFTWAKISTGSGLSSVLGHAYNRFLSLAPFQYLAYGLAQPGRLEFEDLGLICAGLPLVLESLLL